jgi:diguanylate cyclase (GGDEF)-like protein
MKQIGEFANENEVTVRALHHYEKLGLIVPCCVDEFSGYRYYEPHQSRALKAISALKSLGFSLSEIKQALDGEADRAAFIKSLYAKKKQAQVDADSARLRYGRISALLKTLELTNESAKLDIEEIINMNSEDILVKMTGHERFNYIAFKYFEEAKKQSTPLCVLCMDIDNFKKVNDDLGHDIGDIVIQRIMDVAVNTAASINPENKEDYSMLERVGGDEFRIVIKDDVKTCEKLAQNIIEGVAAIDFADVADGLHVSVTCGIASKGSGEFSASHLFHLAESVLYEAKSKQRGTYIIYNS